MKGKSQTKAEGKGLRRVFQREGIACLKYSEGERAWFFQEVSKFIWDARIEGTVSELRLEIYLGAQKHAFNDEGSGIHAKPPVEPFRGFELSFVLERENRLWLGKKFLIGQNMLEGCVIMEVEIRVTYP